MNCTTCGAAFVGTETCEERFTQSQLMEVEQPAYYAVHHLSVPCYMLQHNAYSRPGWLAVYDLLGKFVVGGWTPAMARRTIRDSVNNRHRNWSFTRGPKLRGVEHIVWAYTLAQVRLDTAEYYCADVLDWAKSVLADAAPLIQTTQALY